MKLTIPFVDRTLDLDIPDRNLIFDVAPRDVPPVADFAGTIRQALAHPIGTPRLAEMLKPGMKVILICDDNTRVTPVRKIIPLLLEELNAAGVPDGDIRIILASGTHRQMTTGEIDAKYGREITSRVQVIRHHYKDPQELTNYGVTSRGIPVVVNRNVVEADFRIAVGNIVPHHPAGWAAGAKAVLPGVGGEETVAAMHLLGSHYPALGLRDLTMRKEMEDFAEVIHLNFILNVILNRDAGLVGAVAGHYSQAHRAGVELASGVYGVPIPELADLTISSATPMDFDFFQGDKGITSGELSTRPGGEIVLVAGCLEGISPAHPELAEYVGAMTNEEIWKLVAAKTVKDPLTAAEAIVINDIRAKMAISLVSRGISQEKCQRLGFTYVAEDDLNAYIAGRIQQQPGIKIGILRHSADVLPLCGPVGRRMISLAARTARYRAWLQRLPAKRPLIGLLWEPDIPPLPEFLDRVGPGAEVCPQDFEPDVFLAYIERCHTLEQQIEHEAITAYTPAFGMPWVEAIAGCRVVAHPGSLWAEPLFESYDERPHFAFSKDAPWMSCLLDFTRAMVKASGGRYPIALPQMRGPLDTLAAMRTPAQLCLDVIDQPEQVMDALSELADLWIAIAAAVLAEIPPFYGGGCSRMKLWAPGPAVTPQNDVSTLFSPAAYRRLAFGFDRRIFDAFPYHSFHMHSTEYRHIRTLLEADRLTAIQLTLDHEAGGPPFEVMLEQANQILAKKPLLLAALDTVTADQCLQRLPSAGLALMVACNTPEIPAELANWLRLHCSDRLEEFG